MTFADIKALCRPGGAVNEDSYSSSARHLLAVDGASGLFGVHVTGEATDARWLAQQCVALLGGMLAAGQGELPQLCHRAAQLLGRQILPLAPPDMGQDALPSAGVIIARLREQRLELYSLGDLTALIKYRDGRVEKWQDETITTLDRGVVSQMVALARERGESVAQQRPRVQEQLQRNRRLRHREDGYAIFDPTGLSALKGRVAVLEAGEIQSVALLSDGMADAMGIFHLAQSWEDFYHRLEQDPEGLYDQLRRAQQADPGFDRHPRLKIADDATALVAQIHQDKGDRP